MQTNLILNRKLFSVLTVKLKILYDFRLGCFELFNTFALIEGDVQSYRELDDPTSQ